MRVKQLRTFLYARGVTCEGCAEKTDFIKKAVESQHLQTTDEREEEDKKMAEAMRGMSRDGSQGGYGGVNGMEGLQDILKNAKGDAGNEFAQKVQDGKGLDADTKKEINEKTKENVAKNFPDQEEESKGKSEDEAAKEEEANKEDPDHIEL